MASVLWLPPSGHQRVLDERAAYADRLQAGMALHAHLEDFNRDLKRLDPYLELVKAHETANHPQLTPGYYHVMRHNPGAAPTIVLTVKGTGGEYREPDSAVFEELARSDGWSDRSRKERERRQAEAERTARNRRNREQEERVDEIMARVKHAGSPFVGFSDVRWTNSTRGKRARKS